MNKIFKKSLIFQWFYTTKWAIILSLVVWSAISWFEIYNNKIFYFSHTLSQFQSDKVISISLGYIIIFCGILIFIYMINNGLNKFNKMMILNSGPYSRKEIFYNNLLCNIIVLAGMIFIYVYIGICIGIKYSDLIEYSSNYIQSIGIDIIKLFILGFLTIGYTLLIDILFSNSFVTIIAIIGIPISLVFSLELNIRIFLDMNPFSVLLQKANSFFNNIFTYAIRYLNFNSDVDQNYITFKSIIIISLVLFIIGILIIAIAKRVNAKIRMENISNFFVFKNMKIISLIIISIILGTIILYLIYLIVYRYYPRIINMYLFLIFEILLIVLIYLVTNKILSKFIKQ